MSTINETHSKTKSGTAMENFTVSADTLNAESDNWNAADPSLAPKKNRNQSYLSISGPLALNLAQSNSNFPPLMDDWDSIEPLSRHSFYTNNLTEHDTTNDVASLTSTKEDIESVKRTATAVLNQVERFSADMVSLMILSLSILSSSQRLKLIEAINSLADSWTRMVQLIPKMEAEQKENLNKEILQICAEAASALFSIATSAFSMRKTGVLYKNISEKRQQYNELVRTESITSKEASVSANTNKTKALRTNNSELKRINRDFENSKGQSKVSNDNFAVIAENESRIANNKAKISDLESQNISLNAEKDKLNLEAPNNPPALDKGSTSKSVATSLSQLEHDVRIWDLRNPLFSSLSLVIKSLTSIGTANFGNKAITEKIEVQKAETYREMANNIYRILMESVAALREAVSKFMAMFEAAVAIEAKNSTAISSRM